MTSDAENPTTPGESPEPPAAQPTRIDLGYRPGTEIGHYRILSTLGEGGFGVVYLAEQTKPVKRRVALKVIKPGMDSKQVIARFEAERQALAMMDHPNVARVFDAGATDDGRPYFVMEHVAGESITDYCDRHRLGTKERLSLFMQTCEAIQHAHQKGIIHRDVKPSNILVVAKDSTPLVKVIDFGVAKAISQRLTEQTIFTQQGQLIGTPEYMSPEQAEMSALDIDTRSDIYSLGVLLYELLTGLRPFDPEALREAGLAEIQRIIREVDPPKPSTKLSSLISGGEDAEGLGAASSAESIARAHQTDAKSLLRHLRGDLDWIVMKAMEKDRSRRYDTASALALDLQRYLEHEPVLAGPPSAMYRVKKFVQRNRASVMIAVLAMLLLLVATGVSTGFAIYADHQRELADRAQSDEKMQRVEADDAKELAETEATRARREEYVSAIVACQAAVDLGDYPLAQQLLASTAEDKRGIEYDILARALAGPFVRLRGHREDVRELAFSPDGRLLASRGWNGDICIWDTETCELIEVLWNSNEGFRYRGIAFSRDGLTLATTGMNEIILFDVRERRFTPRRIPMAINPRHVSASPTENVFAVSFSGGVSVVSADSGEVLSTQSVESDHTLSLWDVTYSPDGRYLVAAEMRGVSVLHNEIVVWDTESGVLVARTVTSGAGIIQVKASNTHVVIGRYGWDAEVYKLPDLAWVGTNGGSSAPCATFAESGSHVLTGDDWGVRIGTPGNESPALAVLLGESRPYDLEYHTRSGLLAVACSDGMVLLGRFGNLGPYPGLPNAVYLPTLVDANSGCFGMCFSADGLLLAGRYSNAGAHDLLRIFHADTGETMTSFNPMQKSYAELYDTCFNQDGSVVAGVWGSGHVACWDSVNEIQLLSININDDVRTGAIEFTKEGDILVGSASGVVWRIDLEQSAPVPIAVAKLSADITDIDRLSDGRMVISSAYGEIAILDERSQELVELWRPTQTPIHSVAINERDGLIAFDRETDSAIVVSNLSSPHDVVSVIKGHRRTVSDIEWILDEQTRLMSTSYDRTARIWDPTSARQLLAFDSSWGWDVAVSPDQQRVALSSWAHRVEIFGRRSQPIGVTDSAIQNANTFARAEAAFEITWEQEWSIATTINSLRSQISLTPAVRELALRIANWRANDPGIVRGDALALAIDDNSDAAALETALTRLHIATARYGSDSTRIDAFILFRLGRIAEAADILRLARSQRIAGERADVKIEVSYTPSIFQTIFLAMCENILGRHDDARTLYEEAIGQRDRFRSEFDEYDSLYVQKAFKELEEILSQGP